MTGFVIVLDSDPPLKDNKSNNDVDLITDTNRYVDYGISTSYDNPFFEMGTDEQLEAVFASCEQHRIAKETNYTSPDGTKYHLTSEGYAWQNSTHYIDNNICYFQSLKENYENNIIFGIFEYCNSHNKAGFDNPYEHWFANETSYIDADTCLWQYLDDGISLVLPTDWESVYLENHE